MANIWLDVSQDKDHPAYYLDECFLRVFRETKQPEGFWEEPYEWFFTAKDDNMTRYKLKATDHDAAKREAVNILVQSRLERFIVAERAAKLLGLR